MQTQTFSRILLTVLLVSAMAYLGWLAYAGLPLFSLLLFITGCFLLYLIWAPAFAGNSNASTSKGSNKSAATSSKSSSASKSSNTSSTSSSKSSSGSSGSSSKGASKSPSYNTSKSSKSAK